MTEWLITAQVTDIDGEQGLLEVKCSFARRQKAALGPLTKCPNRYFHQIQGQLELCNREFCDLVIWIPSDAAILRVTRDRAFFEDEMRPALDAFSRDLDALMGRTVLAGPAAGHG